MEKKSKKSAIIIWGLIGLVVILVVASSSGAFSSNNFIRVAVEQAQRRTITEIITANGKVQPETEVKISPDVSGEIVELTVKEGDDVTKGDLLLKIKPDIYISAFERVKASLNTSHANLANAKARLLQIEAQYIQTELSFKRSKKLYEEKAISTAEYENAFAQHEVAKAEVEAAKQSVKASEFAVNSAEAALKEANENLTKTTIYAPFSGTVSKLNVEKGERVVGTMQMAGTEILRIANLSKMEVKVDVNENDIVKLKLGDTAVIEVDAYLNDKFTGIVTEIANSANAAALISSDQVTNFEVKIAILPQSYKHILDKNPEKRYPFRPGMSATTDIRTQTRYNVLTVPIQAVSTRDTASISEYRKSKPNDEAEDDSKNENTQKSETENNTTNIISESDLAEVVFIVKPNFETKAMKVKTGIQDKNYIEILTGISDTTKIVVAPYSAISKKLSNDTKVEIVKKEDLYITKVVK